MSLEWRYIEPSEGIRSGAVFHDGWSVGGQAKTSEKEITAPKLILENVIRLSRLNRADAYVIGPCGH